MPPIELLEPDGSLSLLAPIHLHAVTFYPDNESKRNELLVSTAVRLKIELEDEEEHLDVPISWLEVLLTSPPAEKILQDAARYAKNSWIAGEILLFMVNAAVHHPDLDVNLTKAVWVFPRLCRKHKERGGGAVSISEKTIWNAWARFKSVAHFHAFRQNWLQNTANESRPTAEDFVSLHSGRLLDYLGMTEGIRRAAVERKIVKHEETWFPPEGLTLPSSLLDIPPLPDSALEELDKFSMEHSKPLE